jgi:hypothetical protein
VQRYLPVTNSRFLEGQRITCQRAFATFVFAAIASFERSAAPGKIRLTPLIWPSYPACVKQSEAFPKLDLSHTT